MESAEKLTLLDEIPKAPWWAFALHWPIVRFLKLSLLASKIYYKKLSEKT